MAKTVPPPPFKSQVTDRNGLLSQIWIIWFRELFDRVGGTFALTNNELAEVQTVNLTEIQADISSLEDEVSNIKSDIITLENDVSDIEGDISDLQSNIEGILQEPVA